MKKKVAPGYLYQTILRQKLNLLIEPLLYFHIWNVNVIIFIR